MASPPSKTTQGLDETAARVLRIIEGGKREHRTRMRRYDHSYDIWRATTPVPKGVEPWQSKLRIKFAKQVIDTELVNIVSGNPRVKVTPRHPEDEMAAKAMQYILDYYVQEDHLIERQPDFALQGLIYGVTVAKVHWLYKTGKTPRKVYRQNEVDPYTPDVGVEMQNIVYRDGPTFEPWKVHDCYWEPGARSVDDAGYVVLKSWIDKDTLRANAYNPDTKTGLYHNVEELIKTGDGPAQDSTAQSRFNRDDRDRVQGKFLIEEIWTDDDLVVLGNQQIVLRAQANPYWHGKKPIVITSCSPDPFEMLGVPETELTDDIQQALWTVINRRMDNEHLTVMRGITYREGGVTNPDDLQMRPRFKWPVADHDDIQPFEVAPLPPESFQEENALKAMMQLVTGVNPYVSGSDLQTVDQNTATGVTALQDVASRILRFKAQQLANAYQRTYEMWGDMTQQFLDKEVAVKIVGQGGDESWLGVGPQDVEGHFTYRLQGTEESLSRQQARGEAIALLNAFAPLAQLGIVNFQPILEKIAEAYDFPNPESLINAPPPPAPPASPQPGQDPNAQGGQPPDLQDVLGPRIGAVPQRNSFLQQGGLQMDPRLAAVLGQIGQQVQK